VLGTGMLELAPGRRHVHMGQADLTPKEWKEYCWIEVSQTVYRQHPPQMIKLEDLPKWIQQQPRDADLYSSVFRYNNPDPYVGGCLSGLLLDFDHAEKPDRARREAVAAVKHLKDRFNIPEVCIRICFSGGKGFHVIINRRVFNISPSKDLPLILKSMAKELQKDLKVSTLDLAVFDRRRLWRLENTRHQKSGLFKVPLTLQELESLNFDQIKALATAPRHLPSPDSTKFKVIPEARRWYLSHVRRVEEWLKKRLEDFKAEAVAELGNPPPCVQRLMQEGVNEGMRNNACFTLACYFSKVYRSMKDVLKVVMDFNNRCSPPLSRKEVESTVKSAWQGVKEGRYSIGCSTMPLSDYCNREECPFFRKRKTETVFPPEILAKAMAVLENHDPFDYMVEVAQLIHAGDEDAIKVEWISALNAKISRRPINTWQLGGSGKGKSHLKYTVLQLLPDEYFEVFTSASPKSLFYYVKEYGEDALDGVLLYIDEVEASQFTLPMLRSLTGQTEITPRHLSVYDAELLDLKIKGKRAVWFTSVKTFGTEQIRNRFIHLNPDETAEQDERIFQLEDEEALEDVGIPEEPFQVAKAITKIIVESTKDLPVFIPWHIKWPFKRRRWLYPIFLSFIRVIAKARFKHRQINSEGYLIPEREDFELAKQLWRSFGETIIYRVSKSAELLLQEIPEEPEEARTHAELSEVLPLSTRQIQNLCHELLEEGLVNRRKRTREGAGRGAWEYWRAKIPSVEDIDIAGEREFRKFRNRVSERRKKIKKFYTPPNSFPNFQNSKIQRESITEAIKIQDEHENKSQMFKDVQPHFQKCSGAEYRGRRFERRTMCYRRVPPAERCPLCGKLAVEYEITDLDGTVLRRCAACFEDMRVMGLKLRPVPEEIKRR